MKSIYSLKGRNLFKEVYQKGRRTQGTGIRIYTLKYNKSAYVKPGNGIQSLNKTKNVKIAIALTKSFGKAYQRNLAKRRIRAICTELFEKLQEGFCIIIRIERDFKNLSYEDQKQVVTSLLIKAGLLNCDAH
ncbi:MAG: ribonuclease P protein component [Spirochaetes bacterium]|nr:ribonuclease P protein component [Spirochaetota bacterium]